MSPKRASDPVAVEPLHQDPGKDRDSFMLLFPILTILRQLMADKAADVPWSRLFSRERRLRAHDSSELNWPQRSEEPPPGSPMVGPLDPARQREQ